MKIYLICPVREATEYEIEFLNRHVDRLEKAGHEIHYPIRDVNQSDDLGLRILSEHKEAMKQADIAQIFYKKSSTGSCFDFGMAVMNQKPLHSLNDLGNIYLDQMAGLIHEYSQGDFPNISVQFNNIMRRRHELLEKNLVAYEEFDSKDRFDLIELGMLFMAGTSLRLVEGHNIKPTPHKSFDNVVLKLSEIYGGDLPKSYLE